MSLKNCRECGRRVSTTARFCPNCRASYPTRWLSKKVIVGMIILLVGFISTTVQALIMVAKMEREGISTSALAGDTVPPSEGLSSPDAWSVSEGVSEMDDTRHIILHLSADERIRRWAPPTLNIRCEENKTEVYVVTHARPQPEKNLDGRRSVRIRLDDGTAFGQEWVLSTDNQALFAPHPIELARQMAGAQRMLFEFTPAGSDRTLVRFTITGIDKRLPAVAELCGWSIEG